jgi:hypothetical protein
VISDFRAASRPNGDKSPHHTSPFPQGLWMLQIL